LPVPSSKSPKKKSPKKKSSKKNSPKKKSSPRKRKVKEWEEDDSEEEEVEELSEGDKESLRKKIILMTRRVLKKNKFLMMMSPLENCKESLKPKKEEPSMRIWMQMTMKLYQATTKTTLTSLWTL
jgi:hypothetical protein